MNTIMTTASDLKSKNYVDLNGKAKDFSNASFWYYTSIETASCILDGHSFYVNNLNSMNDKDEATLHNDDADKIYSLCFCNSNSEKIPMWYLYAGLTGKGASIGFTPSCMLEFINSINAIRTIEGNEFYVKGKDFALVPGWVYYRDSRSRINYKRQWYQLNDDEIAEFENNNCFIKKYPWEYEKEFRIIIINKTKKSWGQIEVVFPEKMRSKLKVRVAPEIDKTEDINYLSSLEGFKKYFADKLLYSELDIHMGLFERNVKDIYKFIKVGLNKDPKAIDAKKIYEIIKNYLPTDQSNS